MSTSTEPLALAATGRARSSSNAFGAIYGTVVACSEVAALSLDHDLEAASILLGLVGTMLVFWIAHVYAQIVSERVAGESRPIGGELVSAMSREWPFLQAGVPAALALLLGTLDVLSASNAANLAVDLGVLNLVFWGVAIGRRANLGALPTLAVALANGAFGLTVVALKVLVG